MALDVFGNWVPPILDTLDPEPPTGGEPLNVIGQPDDSVGNDGQLSIDPATGDIYVKSNGTWSLFVSGGGGGTTEVLGGAADPTNTLTVSGRAIYIQDPDVDGMQNLYAKNSTASNNTDWKLVTSFQS